MSFSTTPTLTLFQVCNNENGDPFNAVVDTMTSNKRDALTDLRKMRERYPRCMRVYHSGSRGARLDTGSGPHRLRGVGTDVADADP